MIPRYRRFSGQASAVKNLIQLIESSSLPLKEELQEHVVHVSKLAVQEPSPAMLERAKFRLSMVESRLKGTDLLIKAAPYLAAALDYFRRTLG